MDNLKSSQRPSIGLIVLLGSLTAFPAISTAMYLPALPQMTANLHTTANAAALTISTFFFGLTIGIFLYGPWSDRAGRRPPLLFGLSLYIAASIGCAFASSIEMLIALRFLQAFGGCAAVIIARAIARDKFDAQSTARVLAYLSLVFGAAPIFGPILGGVFLLVADWRTIFVALGVFGAACMFFVYFFLPESLPAERGAHSRRESPLQSYKSLLRDPGFMAYLIPCGLAAAAMLTYVALSPDLFVQGYGLSAQTFSFVFAANGVGFVAAGQVNGFILRRGVAFQKVLRIATLSAVAFALVLFFFSVTSVGGKWGVGVSLFLLLCHAGFITGNAMAGVLGAQPNRAGAASSLGGAAATGGAVIAISSGGALYDGSPLAMASIMLTCCALSALGHRVFLGIAQRQARAAASTAAPKPDKENS